MFFFIVNSVLEQYMQKFVLRYGIGILLLCVYGYDAQDINLFGVLTSNREKDYFGNSVSISGDTIVVGAVFDDSNSTGVNGDPNNDYAFYSGAACVFVRTEATWTSQSQ
jgi:hypothetical protein